MELPSDLAIPVLGLYPKNPETPNNLCTPMCIASQFTTAKCWRQPKCPSVNKWIKKVAHLHNGILCSKKKKGAPTLCNGMDGSEEHYAKWNKSGGDRKIPNDPTYKWNLINITNKEAKYNQRHRNKEQFDSVQRGWRKGITGDRRGRVVKEHVWRTHGESQRGVGLRVGGGDELVRWMFRLENVDNCTWRIIKNKL